MPTSPTLCGEGRSRVADAGVYYTESQLELQKTNAATAKPYNSSCVPPRPSYREAGHVAARVVPTTEPKWINIEFI